MKKSIASQVWRHNKQCQRKWCRPENLLMSTFHSTKARARALKVFGKFWTKNWWLKLMPLRVPSRLPLVTRCNTNNGRKLGPFVLSYGRPDWSLTGPKHHRLCYACFFIFLHFEPLVIVAHSRRLWWLWHCALHNKDNKAHRTSWVQTILLTYRWKDFTQFHTHIVETNFKIKVNHVRVGLRTVKVG